MFCTFNEGNEMKVPAPNGMTELVRGNDHCLVAQLEPLVRQQNVTLDLHSVGRIDAAGIAALIALYGCAAVEPTDDSDVLRVTGMVEKPAPDKAPSDYTMIDNGYASQSTATPLTGWSNGDFNYDSSINAADYSLIDTSFALQSSSGGPLGAASLAIAATVDGSQATGVPEPASLALFTLAASTLLARRRKATWS